MRVIKLEKGFVSLPGGQTVEATTLDIINKALDNAPEGGLSVADFRARARLDRTIDAMGAQTPEVTELVVDDKDFETIQKAIEPIKWATRSPLVKNLIFTLFIEEIATPPQTPVVDITTGEKSVD